MGPFDPSILGKVPLTGPPSFRESYRFGITLRDLADRRRIQELQLRQHQLAYEQALKDRADEEALQQSIAALGPKPTVEQILAAPGRLKLKIPLITNLRQMAEAGSREKTAELTREKTQAELDAERLKQQREAEERTSGQIFSTIGAPVPAEKPHYEGQDPAELEAQARQVRAMGIVPEGTVAPTFAEARQRWLTAIGPDKARAYLTAQQTEADRRTKAELDKSEAQMKQALPLLLGAANPVEFNMGLKASPPHVQALFPPVSTPAELAAAKQRVMAMATPAGEQARLLPNNPDEWIAWKNQPGRTSEEKAFADRNIKEMTAYHQAIRPTIGGDMTALVSTVKQNPELFEKLPGDTKAAIAPALAAAGFTEFGGRLTEQEHKAARFYNRMNQAVDIIQKQKDRIAKMSTGDQAWYRYAPIPMLSAEDQQLRLAEQLFTEARLRAESGAAISNSEYAKDQSTYFIQAGDKPEVIADKLKAQQGALSSFQEEAGRALKKPDKEKPKEPPAQAAPGTPPVAAAPTGPIDINSVVKLKVGDIDPNTGLRYLGGDIKKKSSWGN